MRSTHEQQHMNGNGAAASAQTRGARTKAKIAAIRDKIPSHMDLKHTSSLIGRAGEAIWARIGGRFLTKIGNQADALRTGLRDIPDRMQKLTNQANLTLELIDDFKADRYRDVRWRNIALGAAALLYTVSPADVIPDFIPGLGALDDAVLLAMAMKLVQRDLERYCEFKGYDRAQYF